MVPRRVYLTVDLSDCGVTTIKRRLGMGEWRQEISPLLQSHKWPAPDSKPLYWQHWIMGDHDPE